MKAIEYICSVSPKNFIRDESIIKAISNSPIVIVKADSHYSARHTAINLMEKDYPSFMASLCKDTWFMDSVENN
jgi:hypothetical protein